jgi:hypothetical protein
MHFGMETMKLLRIVQVLAVLGLVLSLTACSHDDTKVDAPGYYSGKMAPKGSGGKGNAVKNATPSSTPDSGP